MKKLVVQFLFAMWFLGTAHASSDVGYVIRVGEFHLEVRAAMGDLNEVAKPDAAEFASADKLFFDCLRWVAGNQDQLRKRRTSLMVFWNLIEKKFSIQQDDDLVAENVRYQTKGAAQQLISALEHVLKPFEGKPDTENEIRLYVVKSKNFVADTFSRADIFFGAIPGSYMFEERKGRFAYLVLMWPEGANKDWTRKIRSRAVSSGVVRFDRKKMKEMLKDLD